jgi:hypothetical protein
MLALAVMLSFEEEFQGRIALTSLPDAEGFYKKCGMISYPPKVDDEGLKYFEMDSGQSEEFLRNNPIFQ